MKNFDLNELGVKEMTNKQLIEVNGGDDGNPLRDLAYALFELFVEGVKILGPAVVEENCKRAAGDNYVVWADLGHR